MDELARHKIEVVSAPGEAIHIDWVNTTTATPEELVQQASKTYLDWHMLTQVCASSMPLNAKSRCEQRTVAPLSLQHEHGSNVYTAQTQSSPDLSTISSWSQISVSRPHKLRSSNLCEPAAGPWTLSP